MAGSKGIGKSIIHYIIHFFIVFLGDVEGVAGGLKFKETLKTRWSNDPT